MRSRKLGAVWCLIVLALTPGCATTQLKIGHVQQAKTLTSIYEQQVLDNLAMFKSNPDALPFFAVPGAGKAQVSGTSSISANPLNGPGHTNLGPLSFGRNTQNNWTMEPITDPKRLQIMRGLYQDAINGCGECPLILEEVSRKSTVSACDKIGSYCGCSIRVCPESSAAFTRLVLDVLEAAVGDISSPSKPTAQIEELYYNKDKLVKVKKYTIEIPKDAAEVKMNDRNNKARIINPYEAIPRSRGNSIFREQQLQLYRNNLFGN